jgi:phosphatidate cytidylyltransferase
VIVPEAEPVTSQNATPGRSLAKRGNLLVRFISAIVLAPLAIAAAYVGGWFFTLFWAAAAAGIIWEWFSLVGAGQERKPLAAAGGVLMIALLFGQFGRWDIALDVTLLAAVTAALLAPPTRRGWLAAGTLYAAIAVLAPMLIRADLKYGFSAIIFLFAVVWATDIFAYFVGRSFGGPKLIPRISPNKTWSGAIGGSLAAMGVGAIIGSLLDGSAAAWLVLVALAISIIAQAGDLLESWIKRRFSVKNSSELIPGHGGLMDRLDGFVTAVFAAALIGIARGGLDAPARGLMVW